MSNFKRRITAEQLDELTERQKVALRQWWNWQEGDFFFDPYQNPRQASIRVVCEDWQPGLDSLPVLDIGQMIQFLQMQRPGHVEYQNMYDESLWRVYAKGMWREFPALFDDDELCNQLWQAVKTVLE
jgi:hypothetical protein